MAGGEDDEQAAATDRIAAILTPDQRVRVFVSSTMEELATERVAVREAVVRMHLSPVLFELGARAHPPRSLYRSYLEQSHVFVGIYWERYGWVAPTMDVSGLEDEYLLAGPKPKLMYVKRPAPGREPRLDGLLDRIRSDDDVSYKAFADAAELEALVADDLSILLSEAFLIEPGGHEPGRQRFTLPSDATTFVGRATELDGLRQLMDREDVRLITLTGAGGIGKTRLALRAAALAAPAFEEGAAFVSLAALGDERLVVGAIATAVGLREGGGSTVESLAADLATRSVLVVIDNFEHVMGAADLVATLLSSAPRLKVLTTSREALRLHAEHEFPVPPLDGADSARMFAERAAAVRPDFRVDETNRDVIDRICQRLEGVPLAIELAAARTKLLAPEALLDRLDRRLDFLIGGPRDLPERQQALRRTIEWSYDLLDELDRRVFCCLGVFVGSFSLAAAEALAPASGADGRDVLDLLASLVDKSLLRVEAAAGEPRFRMLEMIAEFARDRLAESEDAASAGALHATYCRDLSLEIGGGVLRGDQRHWLQVLGDDHDGEAGNLRAAMAWFIEHRRLDDLADMAWALWVPAWINGRIDEGRRLASAALESDGPLSERSRARLLVVLGLFHMWSGNHGDAAVVLQEGGSLAAALGDDGASAAAILAESMIAGPIDGEARSEELAEQTLGLYRQLGDTWGQAAALNVLGWLYVAQERFDGTRDVFEDTLSVSQAAGDEQFSAMAEVNLAECLLAGDDVESATELISSCAERHRSMRLMYSVAYLLEAAARLASRTGDPERAARLMGAASQMRVASGLSVWGSQLDRRNRFVDGLRDTLGADGYEAAFDAGCRLCYSDAVAETSPAG